MIFLAFVDYRFVEKVIYQCHGKLFLGSVVQATRLDERLIRILNQLKPNFGQLTTNGTTQGTGNPPVNPFSLGTVKTQNKPVVGLSDILEAFDSLSMEQQLQLKATLQLKPVTSPDMDT